MKLRTYLIREWEIQNVTHKAVKVIGMPVKDPIGGYRWFTFEDGAGINIAEETTGIRAGVVSRPSRTQAILKLKKHLKEYGAQKFSEMIEAQIKKYGPVKTEPEKTEL